MPEIAGIAQDNKNAPHTDTANPFLHQVRSQNRIRKRVE